MKKPASSTSAAAKSAASTNVVETFLAAIADDEARADCAALAKTIGGIVREEPKLWPGKMLGFGDMHYRYASGRDGDTFLLGFAYRKTGFSIYLGCGLLEADDLLGRLGKYKHGVGCLYVRRLADVDRTVLRSLLARAARNNKAAAKKMNAGKK